MTFWDPRSDADHVAMARLLAPLIVASRDRNFIDKASATAQTYTWRISLADVPRPILETAIENLIRRGVAWMPRPGEVKAECAKVVAAQRTAAAKVHLEDCEHSSHFIEIAGRVQRCPCWTRAQLAMAQVGQPIALEPSREDRQELA